MSPERKSIVLSVVEHLGFREHIIAADTSGQFAALLLSFSFFLESMSLGL